MEGAVSSSTRCSAAAEEDQRTLAEKTGVCATCCATAAKDVTAGTFAAATYEVRQATALKKQPTSGMVVEGQMTPSSGLKSEGKNQR